LWGDDHRESNVGLGVQAEELGTSLVDFSNLRRRILGQVFSRQLVEAVVELELGEH